MRYIEGRDRDQIMFSSMDMHIGQDNIVRLIDLIVEKFYQDNPELITESDKGNKSTGRKAYNPKIMMGLFVYGYYYGVSSSRKLERATHYNLEVMWLTLGLQPDFWTICEFRRENTKVIGKLIKRFRQFLVDQEFADGGKIVFDGSKMKAYANKELLSKPTILKKLEDVDESIKSYLEQMEALDTAEVELETAVRNLEIFNKDKEELLKDMAILQKEKESLEKDKQILKKHVGKLEKKHKKLKKAEELLDKTSKKYIAPNDPEAILVKSRDGKIGGYNVQAGVDTKGHFILNADVTTQATDQNLLESNVESVTEQTGIQPEEITADKGYGVANDILEVEEKGIECYVPLPTTQREKDAAQGIEFIYNEQDNNYTCSNGKTLKLHQRNVKLKDGSLCDRYQCYECEGCPLRAKCTKSKTGRTLKRKHNEKEIQAYKKSLDTKLAKEKISKRKEVVEHPFGTIKILMGKFHFLLTGQEKVQTEINLYSMAYNLIRLKNTEPVCLLMNKIEKYNWNIG